MTDDTGGRGRLEVDLGVVRRVVERTADRTDGAAHALAATRADAPRTRARVRGAADVVDVRLELALSYPGPVRRTVETLREGVRTQVLALTGFTVRRLDVEVSALVAAPAPAPATAPAPTGPVPPDVEE